MKIGKTFHFIASIISIASTFAMLLPIADVSGAVNMIKSAFGIDCKATWSNTVIAIMQVGMITLGIFIIISKIKKYHNYDKVSKLKIPQIAIASIMSLLAFLTLAIIGIPSGSGLSVGPGPIIFGVFNLIVVGFLILSFVYLNKKEDLVKVTKDKEIENVDLLIKYKELYDKKIITKEEYEKKKRDLLK